jgi:dTDP-4-dehydrorhamnose 3,5-epimerase
LSIFVDGIIDDCLVTNFPVFEDSRGEWRRVSDLANFETSTDGSSRVIKQVSVSINRLAGTLRGLHFLDASQGEFKNVSCVRGSVLDVIVDLRKSSTTFGHVMKVELNAQSTTSSVIIPPGCAHGFQTLQDDTILTYAMTAEYSKDFDFGINPLDPELAIIWPLDISDVSPRDLALPTAQDFFA